MWSQATDYLANNTDSYISSILEHIGISSIALVIAILIGIPTGFFCVRFKRSQKFIVTLFQILRVIPSLAVLLLLIPIMGTGIRPALAALVLLAVPPILINTVTGLHEVPDFMLETAAGCGMTDRQTWQRVRFPLAMPMILTGIKTAVIEIIASATLASKIGGGGLGDIIFTGLGLSRFDLLLIGGVTVAILSVSSGLLFEFIDRFALRHKHI
ncbi:MAG: ABC transporter permease [Oscillospiraceae bacterium]|jgi:osmoprotectant transport system permease protein|nr:ABC transporter permease [Oscillospiraceae bacterium]